MKKTDSAPRSRARKKGAGDAPRTRRAKSSGPGAVKDEAPSNRPSRRHTELPASRLRWTCDFKKYKVDLNTLVRTDVGTVGQDRAIQAIQLGIRIPGPGYNIFVCGQPGTGRTSAVKAVLRDNKPNWSTLRDHCYVHNFKDPDRPESLGLEPGKGQLLKKRMDFLVAELRRRIPGIFEKKEFTEQRTRILDRFHVAEKRIFTALDRRARNFGFVVGQYQDNQGTRQELFPVIEERPIAMGQLADLVAAGHITIGDLNGINDRYVRLQPELLKSLKKRQNSFRKTVKALTDAEKKVARPLVEKLVQDVRRRLRDAQLDRYLDQVQRCLIEELYLFKDSHEDEPEDPTHGAEGDLPTEQRPSPDDPYLKYRINLLQDNHNQKTHPVILEPSPTFSKLFGTIERLERGGAWYGDFMGIKGGSLLQADGGYLIVNCADILTEPNVWITLKRILRHGKLEIQPPESAYQPVGTALKPKPIDVKFKIVMVGQPETYELLADIDEDFAKIFKVKAEFDSEMALNSSNLVHFTRVVKKISREEGLKGLNRSALSSLAEYGVRLSGRQGKLTTQFSDIANIIREASHWALVDESQQILKKHLEQAIEKRTARLNLTETKLQDLIECGILLIDTSGSRVGQVNGLWVYESGTYSFGLPTRITATTTPGRQGLINIEREVHLSGASHDKGVLIMSGFLRFRYARNIPLSLAASICFEQSYSGVDGDSAALAEVLCLISDLSRIPLRQDMAVTGSINQRGQTQAVGGVNEKIEGFFRVCERRGLSGDQGVILPASNVEDLMLHSDVVAAVRRKEFHIFPVSHVDDALEILSGVRAGELREDGSFEEGTTNHREQERLEELATILTKYRHW